MPELLQGVVGVAIFIVMLGVLVLVHEVGHFVAARRANIRVHEFGIGFPPRARVLKNDGETLYTFNWLPIGGFVKLEGEDGDSDDPRSFTRARFSTRQLVLVAGVVMNLVLALTIMIFVAWIPQKMLAIQFETVQAGSPAEAAGLKPGSKIVSVDGRYYDAFDLGDAIVRDLRGKAGQTVTLELIDASGESYTATPTLRPASEIGPEQGALGIVDLKAMLLDQTFTRTPTEAIATGTQRTIDAFGLILKGLGALVTSIVTNPTTAPPVTGPIGIADQVTTVFWQAGPVATLYLAGLLSANLALVNILPFPPLDGGRMLMIAIKRVAGARVSVRAEQATYLVGFACLFAFLIWITAFDILRLGGAVQ